MGNILGANHDNNHSSSSSCNSVDEHTPLLDQVLQYQVYRSRSREESSSSASTPSLRNRNSSIHTRESHPEMPQPSHAPVAITGDEEESVDDITQKQVLIPDDVKFDDACFSFKLFWAYTGPGWLMSIAYLDPGNLESDLQAGAYTGYQLVWILFWSTVMGFVLQSLAARLGVVTGKNLAQMCRQEYPRWCSNLLWVMTELAIVGSDIQEVVGSAIALKLLFGWDLWIGCLVTGFDTFTFLMLHYFGVRKLEAFFAALIACMCVCFFINFFELADSEFALIMGGMLPHVDDYALMQGVAIVGAVIMPHNIYLHSALVQSRKVDRQNPRMVAQANKYFTIEAALALAVSFLINLAVLAVFANKFFNAECEGEAFWNDVCQKIGLQEAGEALEGALGNSAKTIWAIGLLAAGQASTMTGTFAGQFVMEGFLNLNISPWKRVALTRSIALVPAIIVAVMSDSDTGNNHQSDTMDEWLNVLQSVQLPFAVLPILHFTSSGRIMGEFKNQFWMQVLVWGLALLVLVINVMLVFDSLFGGDIAVDTWLIVCTFVIGTAYFVFIFYLMYHDLRTFGTWLKAILSGQPPLPEEQGTGTRRNPQRGSINYINIPDEEQLIDEEQDHM